MKDGKYDNVKHWVGSTVKHYGKTNKTEYFAECTEAFFSSDFFRNDMYPFYRHQLKEFDRDGFDMVAKVFGIDNPDKYFINKQRRLSESEGLGYNNIIENIGASQLLSGVSISNTISFLNP